MNNLSVVFDTPTGPTAIIDQVTFDVRAGETVGVVGESGCGKTITAMSVLALLPPEGRVESGKIEFDGRELTALSSRDMHKIRGKEIGLISQEPMIGLDPAFRVGHQMVETIRRHQGVSAKVARRRTVELLERVRLPEPEVVARRYPHELSGGMAQRVAIARALAGDPKLLIADEPTTALDVTVQAEILDLLRDLQREHGMALMLITHDWGLVADICDRVVVMYAGQVVERSLVRPIFRQPLHPYTQGLLASNPSSGVDMEMLHAIPGTVPKPGSWPTGCHFQPRCAYATRSCGAAPISLELPTSDRETRCIHYDQIRTGS